MKNIVWDLHKLCKRNVDGSFETRAKREKDLKSMGLLLVTELGFQGMRARSLKPKHVEALVERWQQQEIATSTIKTRMSYIRWWAEKIDKQGVVNKTNAAYGIGSRVYVSDHSKAQRLDEAKVDRIPDPYVRMSVRLAAAFGLRKEEAIKFIPSYADQGDYIRLKPSWCKGGRQRIIPVLTEYQRQLLDKAHELAGKASLIPVEKKYIEQRRRYEHATKKVGLKQLHGLRHQYSQDRYQELTGWSCPHAGGPSFDGLTPEQKRIDQQVRLTITEELGHGRINVLAVYLGR